MMSALNVHRFTSFSLSCRQPPIVSCCGAHPANYSSTRSLAHRGRAATRCHAAGDDSPGEQPREQSSLPPLSNPVETIAWGGRLPSQRRAVIGGLTAVAIALGGNLGGLTSFLFSLDGGQVAKELDLDILIPIAGHKRYVDYKDEYEFTYPADWLGDQTLARRTAAREEAARSRDLPSLKRPRQKSVAEPAIAFGPAGSTGEENVSVIVAPIYEGFQLSGLGTPAAAAKRLVAIFAPEGSGRTATVVASGSRTDEFGQLYYSAEFIVTGDKFKRHNCSVYTSRQGADGVPLLFTFNAMCPEDRWTTDREALLASADSFVLFPQQTAEQRGHPAPEYLLPFGSEAFPIVDE